MSATTISPTSPAAAASRIQSKLRRNETSASSERVVAGRIRGRWPASIIPASPSVDVHQGRCGGLDLEVLLEDLQRRRRRGARPVAAVLDERAHDELRGVVGSPPAPPG